MIRERLQLIRAAVITSIQPLKDATNEAAAEMVDEQMVGLVNRIADKISIIELTATERIQISKAYIEPDIRVMQEQLLAVQNTIQQRFYNEVLAPEMNLIHKFRFFALFLNHSTYNELIAKIASLFEVMNQMSKQVSTGLLTNEITAVAAAVEEAAAAQAEFKTFGPIIEE